MAQPQVYRKELLKESIVPKAVSQVNVKEITMEPFQKSGLHQHPCPVFGYVAEGKVYFQIDGQAPKMLIKGEAFFEPANTPIAHFDNAAPEPLKFIAFYLTDGKEPLIEMLPQKH